MDLTGEAIRTRAPQRGQELFRKAIRQHRANYRLTPRFVARVLLSRQTWSGQGSCAFRIRLNVSVQGSKLADTAIYCLWTNGDRVGVGFRISGGGTIELNRYTECRRIS